MATFLAVALLIGATRDQQVSGGGEAEILTAANEHSVRSLLTAVMQAIGFLLLAAPLFFLFQAAAPAATGSRQLVGLVVIAAPLFLAVSAVLTPPPAAKPPTSSSPAKRSRPSRPRKPAKSATRN